MSGTLQETGRLIDRILTTRWYWVGLALLGLFMEGTALYYQYALGDEPCQICIHVRIWVAAFTLLALLMCLLPQWRSLQLMAHLLTVVCMAGLWERCKYLLDVENGKGEGSCNFYLGFPDWFALDAWFPFLFEVRNLCGFTPELAFGVSMAQGLVAVASVLLVTAVVALWRHRVALQEETP